MALLDTRINLDDIEASEGYAALPAGTYPAMIADADVKDTKRGDGQFNITGATHSGRSVFANFNIRNPVQKAEEIGMQQLKQLTSAIGLKGELLDTQQLVGGSCEIAVVVKKSDEFGESNEVKRFLLASDASPVEKDQASPSTPKSPWQR